MTNEMTNEEAIAIMIALKQSYINLRTKSDLRKKTVKENIKAYDMAIKALETIPKYKNAYNKGWDDGAKASYEHLKMCEEEQEPCNDVTTFKEDVLDAISRIGLLKSGTKEVQAVAECLRAVEALPPVNPQEPKWIPFIDNILSKQGEQRGFNKK